MTYTHQPTLKPPDKEDKPGKQPKRRIVKAGRRRIKDKSKDVKVGEKE